MNSQKLKKFIIFLIVLLVISIVTIIIIKKFLKKDNKIDEIITENGRVGTNIYENYGKVSSGGVDSDAYFDIKKHMQKYLDIRNINSLLYGYYNENGEYISTVSDEEIKQKIYNVLSNKYIAENNVTTENLYEYVDILKEPAIFVPVEMSLIQDGEIKSFIVYGLVESEKDYRLIDEIFAVINIEMSGYKFSIEPIKGDYSSIKEIKIDKLEDNITNNEDNEFFQAYVTAEDIPLEYINIYKGLALGNPERLYNLLDEEYRKARFGSIEEFKKYIEKNKNEIMLVQLEKYQVNVEGNKIKYICVDKQGNYYIINQEEALDDYTIILDTYSIDIPEFIEKYNKSRENEKILLNIQKVFQAINSGDYKYVYNKLDNTFKANYFKTQEEFETYIKNNWYEKNEIKYVTYQKNEDIYVYNIEITNADNTNAEKINKKIVMELLEGTAFVMSFNVE